MRIRRYTGKDAQEAMIKVKMDLGSEAIILSTRKVRKKGVFGLFAKPLTEVLAAIDEDYQVKQKRTQPQKERASSDIYTRRGETKPHDDKGRVDCLENKVKQMESVLQRIYTSVHDNGTKRNSTEKLTRDNKTLENRETEKNTYSVKNEKHLETSEDAISLLYRRLSDNEIEPVIISKLIQKAKLFVKEPVDYKEIGTVVGKILNNVLGQPRTIHFRDDGRPTVVMLLGPTGVGKTTTIAKIAAEYSLNHQKKIAFITADTYRIAAVEQLKTYAEILSIPVSIIYAPQEIQQAISEHQDKDLILIDTAGSSHKNTSQFSELKMLIAAAEADEIYLVLSCSYGRAACRDILKHYGFLKDYKLLFTKLDEALVPGMILNVRYATGKPLSYTTAGQSVPDDIDVANVNDIIKSMLQ